MQSVWSSRSSITGKLTWNQSLLIHTYMCVIYKLQWVICWFIAYNHWTRIAMNDFPKGRYMYIIKCEFDMVVNKCAWHNPNNRMHANPILFFSFGELNYWIKILEIHSGKNLIHIVDILKNFYIDEFYYHKTCFLTSFKTFPSDTLNGDLTAAIDNGNIDVFIERHDKVDVSCGAGESSVAGHRP